MLLDTNPDLVLCENGAIRLQGGTSIYEGRVEVCRSQQWGTVCDDDWETEDANIACKQLGFSAEGVIVIIWFK